MRRWLWILLVAGCADGKSVLHVDVTADPAIAQVLRFQVHVTDKRKSRNADITVTPAQTLAMVPPDYSFALVFPPDVDGEVDLGIDAVGDGGILASGANMVTITPSNSASVKVTLGGGVGSDGGADGAPDSSMDLAGGPDGGGVVRTPVRVERTARKMDILFMIDDSPSMAPKQASLRASLPLITDSINALPASGKPVSFHIGVVTSDLGAGMFNLGGCRPGGRGAILQGIGAAAPPECAAPLDHPYIDLDQIAGTDNLPQNLPDGGIGDMGADAGTGTKQTLDKTVGCMISVGDVGCGLEHQLEATYKALHDPIPENVGFLRPDALLMVVILSDEDDCSAPPNTELFDPSNPDLGLLASYRCTNYGVACGSPPQLPPYGPSDGGLTMCQGATAAEGGMLFEVDRYSSFLGRSLTAGGLKANPAEIAVSAIVAPAVPFEVVIGNPNAATANGYYVPQLCTLGQFCQVLLQHSCVAAGNTTINGDPAVRITQVVNALPSHEITNVCSADYTTAARDIGDRITAQFQPACLPGPLANPSQPDCVVSDVKIDGSNSETAIPQCGAGVSPPCWKLTTNAACPGQLDSLGQMEQLVLEVDRGGGPMPTDAIPSASCALGR